MFAIPAPTPYDLKFRLLGIPVRVHPLFWVIAAALGWENNERFDVLIWIACVFLSILVHEFGHGLTAERLYRCRSSVILYVMGGLCSYDADGENDRRPWREALVLLMGPGAGFLLFGLVLGLGLAVIGVGFVWPIGMIVVHQPPSWFTHLPESVSNSIWVGYSALLYINFFWGIFNLLPIFPLDGGRLAALFLTWQNRREGLARAHILGILAGGGLAIYFAYGKDPSQGLTQYFNSFLAANLAFLNYRLLQAEHARRDSFGSYGNDDDWRR